MQWLYRQVRVLLGTALSGRSFRQQRRAPSLQLVQTILWTILPLAMHVAGDATLCYGQPPQLDAENLRGAQQLAIAVDDRLAASTFSAQALASEQARTASERLPNLAVRGAYELRSDDRAFDFADTGLPLVDTRFPYRQRESAAVHARARVPLYTSGRISASVAAADARARSADLSSETIRLDVMMAAGDAFIEVLRQGRLVAVRDASVRTLAKHAHDVHMAYEQGMATRNELLTANVRLSAAQQALLQAHHAEDLAWSEYNRRVKRPLTYRTALEDPDVPSPPGSFEGLVALAHRNRPEAAGLAVRSQAFQHEADAHRRRSLPQFYAEGGLLFEENRYQSPEEIGYVGVVVDWDVWDGGASGHRHDAAHARAVAATRRRSEFAGLIELEVRRAWLSLAEALSRLEATRTDIAQAEENLRVVQQLFREGMARSSDVLEAEAISSESRLRHWNARYDAVLAQIELERAVGGNVH